MKKRLPPPKIKESVPVTEYHTERHPHLPWARSLFGDPKRTKQRRKASYIPGTIPLDEPPDIPRLFIRGVLGGSFKMDLLGLDINLSEAAFAHWVTDESLTTLHIHQGDIAIVDPLRETLEVGNLILLDLDGRTVLRLLTRKRGVWFVEAADGTDSDPRPLLDYPLYGVALGILRLFTKVKAVVYRGTNANFKTSFERKPSQVKVKNRGCDQPAELRPKAFYSKSKKPKFLLAAEKASPHCFSEIETRPVYSVRAKMR